jgi:hypothetical protein
MLQILCGVEHPLHAGANLLGDWLAARGPLFGGADEVEEVSTFDVVELQGASDCFQHAF